MPIRIPAPNLQVNFAASLLRLREVCLLQALRHTVGQIDVTKLDQELAIHAPKKELAFLAAAGLRGETAFCTPLLLKQSPALLGYYRLLLGFSQKAFYTATTGLSKFRCLEAGRLPDSVSSELNTLCRSLNESSSLLTATLSGPLLTESGYNDLTLLTYAAGPMFVKELKVSNVSFMLSMISLVMLLTGPALQRREFR